MTDNMIELKKDSLRQMQTGDIKLGFTIQHNDMPDYLFSDPMGKRYYVVFIDADYYDETEGKYDSQNHNETTEITPDKPCPIPTNDVGGSSCSKFSNSSVASKTESTQNEKSEGLRMLKRAHCLCKDEEFKRYANEMWVFTGKLLESEATEFLYHCCDIASRSELVTNKKAQEMFEKLDQNFKDWRYANRYSDNLNRE
ncbi:MAG: hypothetical protein V3V81_07310 [Candidatus Bathyarchaeia archaeon]